MLVQKFKIKKLLILFEKDEKKDILVIQQKYTISKEFEIQMEFGIRIFSGVQKSSRATYHTRYKM